MLYKNEPVASRRSFNEDLRPIYVVVGDGDRAGKIKTEYFCQNKDPSLAKIDYKTSQGRKVVLQAIRLDPDLAQRGWLLLEEEYEKEGRRDDWEEFLAFQDACRHGQVRMDDATREATRNDPCPGFPTEMLPKSVQELHRRGRGPNFYWQPKKKINAGEAELASELPADSGSGAGHAPQAAGRGRRA